MPGELGGGQLHDIVPLLLLLPLQWAESKTKCPFSKRRIFSIMHSVRADDDYEEHVLTPSAVLSIIDHQAGGQTDCPAAHSHRGPAAAQPAQPVGLVPGAPLGGLQPNTWASLFWDHPALLQPLVIWVCQELGLIFGNWCLWADLVESLLMTHLVLFGLDKDLLV